MKRALGLGVALLVAVIVAWLVMDVPDTPQAPPEPPSPATGASPRAASPEGPVPTPAEQAREPRPEAPTEAASHGPSGSGEATATDAPSTRTARPEPAGAQAVADTGPAITVWPATAEGIMGAVREAAPRMKPCYEEALRERPGLGGKVVAEVQIVGGDGLGVIDRVDLVDDTVDDLPLADCLLDVLSDLQFDPPADGGTMRFTYPFVFVAD